MEGTATADAAGATSSAALAGDAAAAASSRKRARAYASREATERIRPPRSTTIPLDRHKSMLALVFLPLIFILFLLPTLVAIAVVAASVLYYFVLIAFFLSEIAVRPPWYRYRARLEMEPDSIPPYWFGVFHDPGYDFGLPYEEVEFAAFDGRRMRGWLVPAEGGHVAGADAVICVHGGGRDRRAWLRHLPLFRGAGCAVLLFDFLEHGASEGSGAGFTYGVRERWDVLAAVRYMKGERGSGRVVLAGTSIGASSAILAAAAAARLAAAPACLGRELPRGARGLALAGAGAVRVAGVIAENAPARPEELLLHHAERLAHNYMPQHKPAFRLLLGPSPPASSSSASAPCPSSPLAGAPPRPPRPPASPASPPRLTGRRGAQRGSCAAIDAAADIACPFLVMHGTADEIVPHTDSARIFARAAEPKQLWIAPDATHCSLYEKHREEYTERVTAFLRAVLAPVAPAAAPDAAPTPAAPSGGFTQSER
eukprot:tig00000865_g5080.t1